MVGRFDYPGAPIGTNCPSASCPSNAVPELWYSFNWGNTHVVAINSVADSSSGRINSTSPGVAWLMNDLQAASSDPDIDWIITFFHHPMYTNGKDSSHSSNASVRTVLEPIFNTYGVDVVFQGHQHSYERTLPVTDNGTTIDTASCVGSVCTSPDYPIYILQGTGGDDCTYSAGTAPWSAVRITGSCGYNNVTVSGDQLSTTFIDTNGIVRDSLVINRVPDTTNPVLSSVSSLPSFTAATISWVTDDISNSSVEYGLVASVLDQAELSPAMVADHSIQVTGLASSTTYFYKVTSCNPSNLCSSSPVNSFTTPDFAGCSIYQEEGGSITVEAENYNLLTPASGYDWVLENNITGFDGTGFMRADTSGVRAIDDSPFVSTSPELSYSVNFQTAGTYNVWLRGYGGGSAGENDSVHVGLDGAEVSAADKITTNTQNAWVWAGDTMDDSDASPDATVTIPTPGTHTVNVWMRENDFRLDKIYLTTSATVPSATGPVQNGCSSAATPTPTLAPQCELTAAAWGETSSTEGDSVTLSVIGNSFCDGEEVSFEVRE